MISLLESTFSFCLKQSRVRDVQVLGVIYHLLTQLENLHQRDVCHDVL